MTIPLLEYTPSSQNQRVNGYDIPNDDQPRRYCVDDRLSPSEMDVLIESAYRQILFHAFEYDRAPALESQLRSGQITVRNFVRGLLLSPAYHNSFYELNSNYRFVEQCIRRVLGRDVYGDREKLAWSIKIATLGYQGFIEALLNSNEYLENFGDNTVPYPRRRVLVGHVLGDRPVDLQLPRYDGYYRSQLQQLGHRFDGAASYRWSWQRPPYPQWVYKTGTAIAYGGAAFLGLIVLSVVLSWFGWIQI
ncbi:MAG: phycobilisome rod-core linker polypeptide CpcG [Leptolyngbyaceae cyanobacterium SM1_1_3]|nr:phycobilisome rod-core linker polypeptide CpcG [Leptolyngbyaceae cyanobacterium SM1_1_3]NJN03198.1 phycobilisome rod-core linker polypeptide CpcG [Leptolyngbyaceae cyanobacterium RM1_1_2]NJO08883.1 phycobilisome rod-core linker polypeptide CpcG [Leptolyngbyaceae cyanobacterium SL_1_1]